MLPVDKDDDFKDNKDEAKQTLTHFCSTPNTLDARGLLARQRRGASELVVLVGERPLAQAAKSFERADPITLPVISSESRFDPGNLIGRLEKSFLEGLLLVKFATILTKPDLQSFP